VHALLYSSYVGTKRYLRATQHKNLWYTFKVGRKKCLDFLLLFFSGHAVITAYLKHGLLLKPARLYQISHDTKGAILEARYEDVSPITLIAAYKRSCETNI